MEIKTNIDLFDHVAEYDIVLVGTNISYSMRHGLQRKVAINYPYVFQENLKTKYGDLKKLGTFIECKKEGKPTFLLCYINKNFNTRPDLIKDYLSYESLENCLKLINVLYKGKKIAAPLLGCSKFDGNGDKEKVLDIIEKSLTNVQLTLFDYEQKSREEMLKEIHEKELEVKKRDKQEYYKMVAERKSKENEIKKINGRAKF